MRKPEFVSLLATTLLLWAVSASSWAVVTVCDADNDGDVDRIDLELIFAARNMAASGPNDPRDENGDGVITILDARRCVLRCTLPGCAEPTANTAPMADAGPDQVVLVNDTVTLDGSGSFDADGDALTYRWSLTTPAGSSAALNDDTAINPTFVADVAGAYVAELIVNDSTVDSAPDTVIVTTDNSPPVADAGPDQTVLVTDTVILDGSGSSDVDGDALTYSWSLTTPGGSSAALDDTTAVMPTFVVDVAGVYTAQLTVNDGTVDSAPDTVTVTTDNSPPVADAGPDQTVLVTDTVTLDGSGSSDVDGDALTYSWSLTTPGGSSAALDDTTAVMPTFVADVAGTYVAQLVVNDGTVDSAPDTVNITTGNSPPVADAGPDQTTFVNDTVTLDGSGSSDVDGDALTYSWSLTTPTGSGAALDDDTAVMPTFVVDVAGTYTAQLTVNDGTVNSAPDTVNITTGNSPPVADAGPDQTAFVNDTVTLDGSGSSDVDGDALTYSWSLTTPAGSSAALDDDTAVNPTFVVDVAGTYTAQLIVNDGTVDSAPDTVNVSTDNTAPVANAGPDQMAFVTDTVTLDGSGSNDVDGDALTYSWSLTTPAGSGAALDDDTAVMPTFVVDVAGTYTAQLIVNDGTVDSAPDTVNVSTDNTAPVADAGPDQTAFVTDTVTLDGSGSSDVDGDALTYSWSLTTPAGSGAALDDDTAVMPSFVVDVPGTYTAQLIVNDGTADSAPDTVTVTTDNTAPVADAGPDQTVLVLDTVTLDGSGSSDVDGDALTYSWSLTTPAGSGAALDDDTAIMPTFVADVTGTYVAQLIVNDGTVDSAPDTVSISTDNSPPVADAGPDQTVLVTDTVTLDGSGSSDVDGDTLTFGWSLTTPAGSGATLDDDTAIMPTFVADVPGTYVGQLIVNDGTVDSAPDTVSISTDNSPPVADAGPDQTAFVNDTVTLDGSGSSDVDLDPLTYSWSLTAPAGSTAALDDGTAVAPTFVVDRTGTYVAQLIVNDGTVDSGPDTVTITTQNSRPVADAGPDQSVLTIDDLQLDGSGSSDADGDPLTYDWSVTAGPSGAAATFSDDMIVDPTLNVDTVGLYVVQLIVNDGAVNSDPDTLTVDAALAPELSIDNASEFEGDAGTTGFVFTVSLSSPIDRVVTVDFATADNTAMVSDNDYVPTSGVVTFPANDTTPQSITVTVNGDTFIEPNESFFVNLTNADNATIVNDQGVGTIRNDDAAETITLTPVSLNLFTGDTSMLTVTLSTAAGAGGQVVDLSSSNTFVATVPANVTVPEGDATADFQVTTGTTAGVAVVTAAATGFTPDTSSVNVTNRTMTIELDSDLIGVGRTTTGRVTLSQPAPVGGVEITLASTDTDIFTVDPIFAPIPEAATQASFILTGVGPGIAAVTANASGFAEASADAMVTSLLISFGAVPPVAPGQSLSLPVSLTDPAPAGGVTISLTSSDSTIATITPSVFIPEGDLSPAFNPQVTGLLIGTIQVTGTAPGFAPDTADVTVTLDLVFTPDPLTVVETTTVDITLNLTAPAPAGGLDVSLSTDDTGVATVPASVAVPAGQTSVLVPVTGVAPGSTTLRANSPGIMEETATVNVTPAPPISIADHAVGDDLQLGIGGTLGAPAPSGNLQLTLTSSDTSRLLLSNGPDTPGGASITLEVNAGGTSLPTFYLQALDDNGTETVTITAPGYATDTSTVTLTPSGFAFLTGNFGRNTFDANLNVSLRSVRLAPTSLNFAQEQRLRAGFATVNVPVTSSMPAVGTITSPAMFPANTSRAIVVFDALAEGTTDLTMTQPAGFDIPANLPQMITATVIEPTIGISNSSVGEDLQTNLGVSLGATPPVPTDVTLTVADPSVALISSNADVPGGADLTFLGATTANVGDLWVQGLRQGETTTITVTAAGYQTRVATVTVTPSGFAFLTGNFSRTTFGANLNVSLRSVRLAPTSLNFAQEQRLRAGFATVDVAVVSSDPAVGSITSPASFPANTSRAIVVFDPIGGGTTDLTMTQPGGFETPANLPQTITATVTAPIITFGNATVGEDLQTSIGLTLGETPPVPTDVTLTVADPSIAVISDDPTVPGGATLTFSGVTVRSLGSVSVQGLQQRATPTTITVTATGYQTRVAEVTVTPSGFGFLTGDFSRTTFSANLNVTLRSMRLNPANGNFASEQPPRAGLATVDVAVTSSNPTVGTITSPASFAPNDSRESVVFDPLTAGMTDLSMTQPTGFETPANIPQTITADVTAPDISFAITTVGEDMQVAQNLSLALAPPDARTVTVTVAAPAVATISTDPSAEGSGSLTFNDVTTTSVGTVYVQGRMEGSTVITIQAAGYNDRIATVDVDPSGFAIRSGDFSVEENAANQLFNVRPVRLNPTTLNRSADARIRGGLTVFVTMVNSNPAAGTLVTNPLEFGPNANQVRAEFDPVAAGITTIDLSTPAGFDTPSNLQQIEITVTGPAP